MFDTADMLHTSVMAIGRCVVEYHCIFFRHPPRKMGQRPLFPQQGYLQLPLVLLEKGIQMGV